MRFQAPRGTQDVLPADSHKWIRLEHAFRTLARLYGYQEIRTPTFEDTDLFVRTSGETSDIVTKQMYTFLDKGDRSITLKPEGTAPAMRALLEHNVCAQGSVCRVSYITPFFRYERPQKGRLREAHQAGLELVGSHSAAADAEIIEMTVRYYESIGVPDVVVLLNSIGRDDCRGRYRQEILARMASLLGDMTDDFRARVEKNPLRLLDSKDPAVQEAIRDLPPITDYLEDASKSRLDSVRQMLSDAGVNYRLAPEIVRGLDYYTETVFEVHSTYLGSQSALCGGGRYDHLIKELGGPDTPSVGVGMGLERALIVLEQVGFDWTPDNPEAVVVTTGEDAFSSAQALVRDLRAAGIPSVTDFDGKSMKAQLRNADRVGARFALILGSNEIEKGTVEVRDLRAGRQLEVPRAEVAAALRGDAE
jgi:histidyl-tRNA synthetase